MTGGEKLGWNCRKWKDNPSQGFIRAIDRVRVNMESFFSR